MTNDEQRLAWRTYAAAVATVLDYPDDMGHVAAYADALLAEERKRFDTPAQADDATAPAEPRPWVDLSDAEIRLTVALWERGPMLRADLVRMAQDRLRFKNWGER